MAVDFATLATDIASGPLAAECAPLVSASNYAGIATAFNRRDRAGKKQVLAVSVKLQCMARNIWQPIKLAITGGATTPTKIAADAVIEYLNDPRVLVVDFADATLVAAINQLVTATVITTADRTALAALADIIQTRAEQIGWDRPMEAADVKKALVP